MEQPQVPNPYTHRAMLPGDSPMFYGRESEISKIINRLAAERPQSCAVVGDRRIGKSSLLHRLFWQIRHPQGEQKAR